MAKTHSTVPTSKQVVIPESVYDWFMQMTDEGTPMYTDSLADHIRHAVLSEVRERFKHAYNSRG